MPRAFHDRTAPCSVARSPAGTDEERTKWERVRPDERRQGTMLNTIICRRATHPVGAVTQVTCLFPVSRCDRKYIHRSMCCVFYAPSHSQGGTHVGHRGQHPWPHVHPPRQLRPGRGRGVAAATPPGAMAPVEAASSASRGLMPGAAKTTNPRGSTRNRMLLAAADLLREKGAAAVTV